MQTPTFLRAEWRYLVMLNYTVDPVLLLPLVPPGTELDFFENRTFVSMVGFRFLHTRVFGIPFPGHSNFDEVNLRFYVRRRCVEGWRRGVVFIRELVPRWAIAFVARAVYGEPYTALPMSHRIECSAAGIALEYAWRRAGRWEALSARGAGEPQAIANGSPEEFITEHYWGYTARRGGSREFQVEHPRWRVWAGLDARFEADVATLYGEQFVATLAAEPASAFIADGSAIIVRRNAALV